MLKNIRFDRRIRSRKVMYSALGFVLVGITTMTIAYATLSTTLKISGSAEFQQANWSIKVEEMAVPSGGPAGVVIDGNKALIGEAKFLSNPILSGTTISNFNIELSKPGDEAWMFYRITNEGEIPALLDSITWSEPSVSSSTNNQSDIQLIKNNFVSNTYLYGSYTEDGEEKYAAVLEGSFLCPGETIELEILNEFNPDATSLPTSKVTVSNISVDFNFVSANQNICANGGPV